MNQVQKALAILRGRADRRAAQATTDNEIAEALKAVTEPSEDAIVEVIGLCGCVRVQAGFNGSDDMTFYDLGDDRFTERDSQPLYIRNPPDAFVRECFYWYYDDWHEDTQFIEVVVNNRGYNGIRYVYDVVPSTCEDYSYDLVRTDVKTFVVTRRLEER